MTNRRGFVAVTTDGASKKKNRREIFSNASVLKILIGGPIRHDACAPITHAVTKLLKGTMFEKFRIGF